jgi:transcriptional regulator with XRE-family HTH domain
MEMIINLNRLILEKNKRAWTQTHLAEVCDLSLRTIQRIEKTGTASHETIKALASVFEIHAKDLIYTETNNRSNSEKIFPPKGAVKYRQLFGNLFAILGIFILLSALAIFWYNLVTDNNFFRALSSASVNDILRVFLLEKHIAITYKLPAVIFLGIAIGLFQNKNPWIIGVFTTISLLSLFVYSWISIIALTFVYTVLYSKWIKKELT